MSGAVAWFIIGVLFLLLLTFVISLIVVMYWIASDASGSKLPSAVRQYLYQRGQARITEAEAQLEAARRSGFNWEAMAKLEEEKKKRG